MISFPRSSGSDGNKDSLASQRTNVILFPPPMNSEVMIDIDYHEAFLWLKELRGVTVVWDE
jgi:hypothetical protein